MLVIIQARTSSIRFRNKVLQPIYGVPLIQHVVNRVKKSKKVRDVVVSTSKNKTDDNLIKYLKKSNIRYFRGDLSNVSKRLYKTAKKNKANFFIRINGDSPLIDYKLVNKAIILHKKNKNFDIITNVFPRTFPSGQSVEIIKTSSLKNNLNFFNKNESEHVTKFFYKYSNRFLIYNFKYNGKKSFFKQSIDTKKDLEIIKSKLNKKKFYNFTLNTE